MSDWRPPIRLAERPDSKCAVCGKDPHSTARMKANSSKSASFDERMNRYRVVFRYCSTHNPRRVLEYAQTIAASAKACESEGKYDRRCAEG